MKLQIVWPNIILLMAAVILALVLVGCNGGTVTPPSDTTVIIEPEDPPLAPAVLVTVHVYTNKEGGSVVWCPEELDPVPTTWTYNGTAEVDENSEDILSQCELE